MFILLGAINQPMKIVQYKLLNYYYYYYYYYSSILTKPSLAMQHNRLFTHVSQ